MTDEYLTRNECKTPIIPRFTFGVGVFMMYIYSMESVITNRLIGIEIECVIPIVGTGQNQDVQQLLADILSNHGMPSVSRSYTRSPIPSGAMLAVEHDSSLRDETRYQGLRWSKIELKSAPMAWSNLEGILPSALDILNYFGARVNHSCGLHVHHHLPEVLDNPSVVRNLQHLWWRYHPVIYGLVAPSRIQNTYCQPPSRDDAMRFANCYSYERLCGLLQGHDRYNGLNLSNLRDCERMTVEWRIHHGTTDWMKIASWILATQRWVEHSVSRNCHYKPNPISNTQAGVNAILVTTGLKANSRIYAKVQKELRQVGKYLLKRWKHFNRQDEKSKVAAA